MRCDDGGYVFLSLYIWYSPVFLMQSSRTIVISRTLSVWWNRSFQPKLGSAWWVYVKCLLSALQLAPPAICGLNLNYFNHEYMCSLMIIPQIHSQSVITRSRGRKATMEDFIPKSVQSTGTTCKTGFGQCFLTYLPKFEWHPGTHAYMRR